MEGLWTDNFENDSNNFNYSGDVSNNEPTLAETGLSRHNCHCTRTQRSLTIQGGLVLPKAMR